MAQLARGINCPKCGTLTACSGRYIDRVLVGQCAYCTAAGSPTQVTAINADAPEPGETLPDPIVATLQARLDEQDALIAELKAAIGAEPAPVAPSVTAPAEIEEEPERDAVS